MPTKKLSIVLLVIKIIIQYNWKMLHINMSVCDFVNSSIYQEKAENSEISLFSKILVAFWHFLRRNS